VHTNIVRHGQQHAPEGAAARTDGEGPWICERYESEAPGPLEPVQRDVAVGDAGRRVEAACRQEAAEIAADAGCVGARRQLGDKQAPGKGAAGRCITRGVPESGAVGGCIRRGTLAPHVLG